MRSIFGWDLPPGCSMSDIERAAGGDEICKICGVEVGNCNCPECPVCGEAGNPECIMKHFTGSIKEQLLKSWNETKQKWEQLNKEEQVREEELIKYYEEEGGE